MRQVRSDRLSLGSLPDFKYFRAGFRDMPALAAAIVNVFSFFRNFISLLICWSVTMLAMIQISSEKAGSSNCRPGPILRVVDQPPDAQFIAMVARYTSPIPPCPIFSVMVVEGDALAYQT